MDTWQPDQLKRMQVTRILPALDRYVNDSVPDWRQYCIQGVYEVVFAGGPGRV
jgi:hypothetical protein